MERRNCLRTSWKRSPEGRSDKPYLSSTSPPAIGKKGLSEYLLLFLFNISTAALTELRTTICFPKISTCDMSPYLAQSAKVSQGFTLLLGMSNMLPMNGSGLGPGGRGAGRHLDSTQLVSQTIAPEQNTSQVIDKNIPYLYKERGAGLGVSKQGT